MIRCLRDCGRHECVVRMNGRESCFPTWTLRSGFLRSTRCVWWVVVNEVLASLDSDFAKAYADWWSSFDSA